MVAPSKIEIPEDVARAMPDFFASPEEGAAFANTWPHPALARLRDVVRWRTTRNAHRPPAYKYPSITLPADALADFEALAPAATRIFWIGHASFLLDVDGVRFVIDPIFGRAGGVVPRVVPPAVAPEALSPVQAVLITHGHHDHMDPRALAAIARANGPDTLFVIPKGMRPALPSVCKHVVEISWWESVEVQGVRVAFVPSQHWHRRGLFDTNRGLWGGYVVSGTHSVYHSGDTGFFPGFEAIGRVFDGVDAAILPLGAYEPKWFMAAQHMDPDGSIAAFRALRATHFVGMHWGAYDLSDEPIDAGARHMEAKVREGELERGRTHVLSPGGSLALDGTRGETRAIVNHDYLR